MGLVRLPVSGGTLTLRPPDGRDDLLLLEAPALDANLALALAARLTGEAAETDWETLSVTDLDALILRIRQLVLGDLVRADGICPAKDCGARFDVSFGIDAFLAHHPSQSPRGVVPLADGWFQLRNRADAETKPISFRLPTVADQREASHRAAPERALLQRCVRPADLGGRALRRVEAAMEALAPRLSRELLGQCFECGRSVDLFFDALWFSLSELRDDALGIYDDVHLLASRYHWSEASILALPRSRRARYVGLAREERLPV